MSLLKSLCSPSSVALIGVSRKTGSGALNPLEILINFGYKGKIYPVNPLAESILGYKCYKNLNEIPEVPELAVIMVTRELVPDILRQCADKDIKTTIIISDGFAESDDKGKLLQKEIEEIHKNTGIRILGPNSMGVVNYYAPFTTSFVFLSSRISPVAFVGQSGLFVQGFSTLRIGKAIDIGNGCDIGFDEILSELMDDDEIKIIALHIEELKDPASFSKIIKEKKYKKPIIVFKSGKTKKAKEAVMSHSGSIAGDYEIYQAFFFSLGLLLVESTQDLEDVVYLLSKIRIPDKKKIGIITPSGGAGIICLDTLEKYGFELSKLSKSTIDNIAKVYPSYYFPSNPLDIMSASFKHGYKKVYIKALGSMIEDDEVDIIFCINGIPTLKTIASVINEKKTKKPVLSWIIGGYDEKKVEEFTKEAPVAVFTHPERAFRTLKICMEYKKISKIAAKPPELIKINKEKINKILKRANQKNYDYLFSDALDIIRYIDLPIPNTAVVNDMSGLKDIFKNMRSPVCIKVEIKGGLHKQKTGLIKLGIKDMADLLRAYEEILGNVGDKKDIRAIVVQEMVSDGLELFMGIKRDLKFGPIMMVGKGGIDVELYNDIQVIGIPFNRDQAIYALRKTKISKLIEEKYFEKLANIMIKISTLCAQFSTIKEMDLNPIIINSEGIWIVDAKIII